MTYCRRRWKSTDLFMWICHTFASMSDFLQVDVVHPTCSTCRLTRLRCNAGMVFNSGAAGVTISRPRPQLSRTGLAGNPFVNLNQLLLIKNKRSVRDSGGSGRMTHCGGGRIDAIDAGSQPKLLFSMPRHADTNGFYALGLWRQ